jgi:hypothetical protein
MDEHLFIIIIAIWDRLANCWEYVDYIPFVIQGFQNICMLIVEDQPRKPMVIFLNGWRCNLMVRSLKWKYPHLLTIRLKYKRQ